MVTHEASLGPRPSDVLGRYQLLMAVAKGGMGQVWVARLTGTRGFQKLVAVKTILQSNEDAANLESMLFDEASLASQIHHPNVAETLDLGEQEGLLYLVMEWVYGEPLDHIVRVARRDGGVPLRVAVELIVQACRGLQAAHAARSARGELLGIVHRDVSPQNLLVTYAGVVKLIDFGVAKATQQMARPTTTGEVKGKFAYMAPEQVHGQALDARADVFAMGIVLYWLTTGEHPFRSDNAAATLRNIIAASPAAPSALVPDYPAALETVVMKALARDREHRHASAQELAHALERAVPRPVGERGEAELRAFMERLFVGRIAERTAALEAAMQVADGGSPANSSRPRLNLPTSQSTMRAVSVANGSEAPVDLASLRAEVSVAQRPAASLRRATVTATVIIAVALLLFFAGYRLRGERWDALGRASRPPSAEPLAMPVLRPLAPPVGPDPAAPEDAAVGPLAAPTASSVALPHLAPAKRHDRPSKREVSAAPVSDDSRVQLERPSDPLNRRK